MSKIVELLMKYNGNTRAIERELRIDRKEVEKELSKWNLKMRSSYRTFFWKTQLMIEQKIYESGSLSNSEIMEHLMKTWKIEGNQSFPKEVFSAFLDRSLLSNENQRKGYTAICTGSFVHYNTYISGDERLFSELLSRFALYFFQLQDEEPMKATIIKTMKHMFKREEMDKGVFETLRYLNFQMKSGAILEKNVEAAVSTVRLEEWPFYQGMTTILMEWLQDTEDPLLIQFRDRITEQNIDQKTEQDTPNQEQEAVAQLNPANQPVLKERIDEDKTLSERFVLIDQIIQAAKQLRTVSDKGFSLEERVRELEEENKRLYAHIEHLELQKKDLQYKKLLEVFQAIAGKSSRYLLSELYNNVLSENELDAGRFKNLFNELRIAGIEPITHGFELNQEIKLTKDKLRDHFMMTKPIVSEETQVTIRLVRQGWAMNGRVLVSPLAEEVMYSETIEKQ